jgi:hypothetical protein
MLFDTPHSPGWRHPLVRAATPGITNRGRGYDPNQPRVPAGDPDGGQWTRGCGSASAADAVVHAGQRFDPGTVGLHDRAHLDARLASDLLAGSGDARIQLLPLTDVDLENGWTPELDYVASRGRGGPRYSPAEQLRIYQYGEALRNVRRYDPGYTEVSNPTSVPSQAAIARLEALGQGLARTHSYFEARGISVGPHALRSIAGRPTRGNTPETALRAHTTGRLFYDYSSGYFVRRDSQTGVYVVITSPREAEL